MVYHVLVTMHIIRLSCIPGMPKFENPKIEHHFEGTTVKM